ncbi:MAG: DUF1320 domain-containing protein [Phycisphaerae bacterium]|nr:DUF1320 domain-containing protein [Phycisphaerae bacterium]
MPYITDDDIKARLGPAAYVQLTDDEGTGVENLERLAEARLGAIGEADSYLAGRYAVPVDLTAHPELAAVLRSFVLDLAAYRLHQRRPPVPPDVVRRHDEAVAWLTRVASGVVHLPAARSPAADASRAPAAIALGPGRVFRRDDFDDA